jgi:hypothetical protein
MNAQQLVGHAAATVGGLQLLANLVTVVRGPLRIRVELQAGAVSERFADLLSVAWTYGSVANLWIAGLLILLITPLREGSVLAWRITVLVGLYYVVVGLATYLLGVRRHAGLLVFVLFGLALLVPLWASRAAYTR